MRSFREERLAKIASDETPVPMSHSAYIVIHVLPLVSFSQQFEVDLNKVAALDPIPSPFVPISRTSGWGPATFNFDGLYCQSYEPDRRSNSYVQMFRNGCIEAADNHILDIPGDRRLLYDSDEKHVVAAAKRFLRLLSDLAVAPPYFVMLSFINVKGYAPYSDCQARLQAEPIDREHLIFPEVMVNGPDEDCAKVLKRSFDMLWQACGRQGSPNYDEKGDWIGESLNRH